MFKVLVSSYPQVKGDIPQGDWKLTPHTGAAAPFCGPVVWLWDPVSSEKLISMCFSRTSVTEEMKTHPANVIHL